MKIVGFLWLGFLVLICSGKKESSSLNLRVQALSPYSLQVTWDPPLVGSETLVGYSLVFVPVQSHQKRRTHVELFMNQHNLTNLRPGTRYKIKVAPLMKNGKLRGVYTSWVNARTPEENNTVNGQNRDLTVGRPSSYRVPGHCLRIAKLCENIGYNFTQMPNYFKQRNQNDAEHELSQFTRMIQSKCSSVLHVFLCSLYFPPCADDAGRTTPPCRSVCRTARRDCEPWIKRSGFKWPYKFECSSFPDPSESACVGEDGSITQVETKMPKECQPLKVSMCKGLGYSYVTMPNFFRDRTQREAELRIEEFSPLVKINCSPTLQFFLCLLYVPPCVINMVWKIPPCREVCEEARRGCEPVMLGIGFPWPEIMNCTRFPTYGRKGSGFCLKPKAKTTTAPNVIKSQSRCEPLRIPMCQSLNYTHTILPNFLNHSSQLEVKRALREFKAHLKSKCSHQLRRFVCFLFAPYCTSDGTPLPPCQSFCEKVKTECGHVFTLLANLNCTRFPTLSRKRLCFGDPLTTMDCVGRHSRPCTVISTTFPIILKCSSPGVLFTIDEIIVALYNGTSVLMTSTSDALRQCDQSRQQVEGRHECQFTINYGNIGIDLLSVSSVAVKYHCFAE